MKTIPSQEIKRRGISALDELLESGPVQVLRNNRPSYVVLRPEDYERLLARRSLWELADQPARGTRSRKEIDERLRAEREGWGGGQ